MDNSDRRLIKKHLESFKKDHNIDFKLRNYNKLWFDLLFQKYEHFYMVQTSYCCNGKESMCWQELVEEGNWGLTIKWVHENIKNIMSDLEKLIVGKNERFYVCETEKSTEVYIYMRDLWKEDINITFTNKI